MAEASGISEERGADLAKTWPEVTLGAHLQGQQ